MLLLQEHITTVQRKQVKLADISRIIKEIVSLLNTSTAKQKRLLYSSVYAARTRLELKDSKVYRELELREPVIIPSISLDSKTRSITFDVLKSQENEIQLFYSRGYIVYGVSANMSKEEKLLLPHITPLHVWMFYTFPPKTIESYLAFYLNKGLQKIITDFIDTYKEKLPSIFRRNLTIYTEIEHSIPRNIKFNPKLKDVYISRVDVRLVDTLRAINGLFFKWTWPIGMTYRIYLIRNQKSIFYDTYDLDGVVYLASVTNTLKNLESYVKLLGALRDVMSRGVLVLLAENNIW